MKINDIKIGLYSYQNQLKRPNTKDAAQQSSKSDVIQISAEGQKLSQSLQSGQADRQQKIEELKQQINQGTYQADSGKIAEKLINFWKK